MVSFRTTLLAFATATAVSALDYWVEPTTVPMAMRRAWCNDQRSMCVPICLESSTGQPQVNTCDPETLTYGCVCSDGKQPNVTEYTLTLPYHMCTQWGTECVKACGSDNQCASDCREQHPCGAQSPKRVNETTTTTSAATTSATAAPTDQVFDGLAGSTDGGDDSGKNAAGALRFGDSFGLAVVAGGLFAGFAVLL